jgi:dihydroneopterin aldolase
MPEPDTIEIRRLRVSTHIGVPDEERAAEQVLFITVRMVPGQGFDGLADEITRTIDYAAVAAEIQALAAAKPRRLIETLAVETAGFLLGHHPLQRVDVTIEKHILPDTDFVAVHVTREK